MKYHVYITLDGCYEADTEAETQQEAADKAFAEFEKQDKTYAVDIYPIEPKKNLPTGEVIRLCGIRCKTSK